MKAVSTTDIAEIMESLVRNAKHGDVDSAKLVFAYAVGKPIEMTLSDLTDTRRVDIRVMFPGQPIELDENPTSHDQGEPAGTA